MVFLGCAKSLVIALTVTSHTTPAGSSVTSFRVETGLIFGSPGIFLLANFSAPVRAEAGAPGPAATARANPHQGLPAAERAAAGAHPAPRGSPRRLHPELPFLFYY